MPSSTALHGYFSAAIHDTFGHCERNSPVETATNLVYGFTKMNSRATNSAAIRSDGGNGDRRACAGFTFIELLITMAIIITISAMAIPSMQGAILAARNSRAVGDVRTIGQAALGYYAEYGAPPNTLVDIGYDQQVDPWGHAYQYLGFTATTNTSQMRVDRFRVPINTFFDLYSMGADGQTDPSLTASQSQDDIVWGNDGFYMGLASNY